MAKCSPMIEDESVYDDRSERTDEETIIELRNVTCKIVPATELNQHYTQNNKIMDTTEYTFPTIV